MEEIIGIISLVIDYSSPHVGRAVRAASSSAGLGLVRALAWARVPAWLAACGAGRPVGPGVRRACLRSRKLFGGLDWYSDTANMPPNKKDS